MVVPPRNRSIEPRRLVRTLPQIDRLRARGVARHRADRAARLISGTLTNTRR
jgi:hypothetical protein